MAGRSGLGLAVWLMAGWAVLPSTAVPAEPGDIVFVRQAAGMDDVPPAVFPHWIHRLSYKCQACHDTPFKMQVGANPVTMDDIQAGQSCGACHDGKIAFISNLSTCNRCHRE